MAIRVSPIHAYEQNVQTAVPSATASTCNTLHIIFTDLLPTTLTCVLPNAFSWAYRTLWTGSIQSYTLLGTAGKTADLFCMGRLPLSAMAEHPLFCSSTRAHSHPLTLLHLADLAKPYRTVFSIHLPYDDEHPEDHQLLLKESIDKIEELIAGEEGYLSDLFLGGHSRGAIEALNAACVRKNPKVRGVITIACRFRVIKPSLRPCRPSLEPTVDGVWQKVKPPQRLPVKSVPNRSHRGLVYRSQGVDCKHRGGVPFRECGSSRRHRPSRYPRVL